MALINASGNREMYDLTKSGYTDSNAKWVLDGKAMIWFSDRAGYRSHGSWGAEMDVYIMFFDLEAYEKFVRRAMCTSCSSTSRHTRSSV